MAGKPTSGLWSFTPPTCQCGFCTVPIWGPDGQQIGWAHESDALLIAEAPALAVIARELAFGETTGRRMNEIMAEAREILGRIGIDGIDDDCAAGLHDWVDKVGKPPTNTRCGRCGEQYGNPK